MAAKTIARYQDLEGKSVFISGGASGIGEDMVRAFHDQGARVTYLDLDAEAGARLRQSLAADGGQAPRFIAGDVTCAQVLKAALDAACDSGGVLDVLVNNAANDTRCATPSVGSDDWDRAVAVNLKHQFFAAQMAFPALQASTGGSVINFASVAPMLGLRNLAVYSTCKSAVKGLTRALAREFGDAGVRVNAIIPGSIITPRQRALWISEEDEQRIQAEQCLHRRLVGADVAQMALFLASDASSACTSQGFVVDGGLTG